MKKWSEEWTAAKMAEVRDFYRTQGISEVGYTEALNKAIPDYLFYYKTGDTVERLFMARVYLNILIEDAMRKERAQKTRKWRAEETTAKEAADKIAAMMDFCRARGISLSLSGKDCQFRAEGKRYRIREDDTIIDLDDCVEIAEGGIKNEKI